MLEKPQTNILFEWHYVESHFAYYGLLSFSRLNTYLVNKVGGNIPYEARLQTANLIEN